MPNSSHSVAAVLILAAYAFYFILRDIERHGVFPEWMRSLTPWRKVGLVAMLLFATVTGADKAPPVMRHLFRLLFWSPQSHWALAPASQANAAAEETVQEIIQTADDLEATATNDIAYISFDWHVPDRLPYHARQNVLAWTCDVRPIIVDGVLHEDHYLSFSANVSTNPAVIEIEYAGIIDGLPYRELSNVVTSSYPASSVITLQSGSHTCFWFRCKVPAFAIGTRRDWSGEALFGSASAGGGFDLVGLLQVDADGDVYVGRTGSWTIGDQDCTWTNGILIETSQ